MIDKIEGYDTYEGVIGDLVDKVNELVEVVNTLVEELRALDSDREV